MYKMRDDVALKMFSFKSLFSIDGPNLNRSDYRLKSFVLLFLPLSCCFIEMPIRERTIIATIALKYCLGAFEHYDAFNGKVGTYGVINSQNTAGTTLLTIFDKIFLKEYVCYLACLLDHIANANNLRILSLASYHCECFFAHLRL